MNIFVKAKPGRIYEAVEDARTLLADRALDNMEVNGEYLQDSNRYLTEQLKTITLFLGAFAFIAVLVSAIGILSIMLVSVVERTREIGLRQALGASKRIIVGRILNESLVFSAAGSVLGLIAAYFTAPALISTILEEAIYTSLSDVGRAAPPRCCAGAACGRRHGSALWPLSGLAGGENGASGCAAGRVIHSASGFDNGP